MNLKKSILVNSLAIMLMLVYSSISISSYAETQEPMLTGAVAPEFNIEGLTGNIKLSDYKGKVVYLDFWASWCAPCRKSFPWMAQMYKKYQSQGLVVIAVNLDQERNLADDFLSKYPGDFIIGFDQAGVTPQDYKVQGMPSAVLIDRTGTIVSRHIGFNSSKQQSYEQAIVSILK